MWISSKPMKAEYSQHTKKTTNIYSPTHIDINTM